VFLIDEVNLCRRAYLLGCELPAQKKKKKKKSKEEEKRKKGRGILSARLPAGQLPLILLRRCLKRGCAAPPAGGPDANRLSCEIQAGRGGWGRGIRGEGCRHHKHPLLVGRDPTGVKRFRLGGGCGGGGGWACGRVAFEVRSAGAWVPGGFHGAMLSVNVSRPAGLKCSLVPKTIWSDHVAVKSIGAHTFLRPPSVAVAGPRLSLPVLLQHDAGFA